MLAQEMFMAAEADYRRGRLTALYGPRRRHHVRRRPSLHVPHPRRRPLSLA
jgi:hypothetical protein